MVPEYRVRQRIRTISPWELGRKWQRRHDDAVSQGLSSLNRYNFISWTPIVTVNDWDQAEERPTGSREKVTLIEPKTSRHYIFKLPKPEREHQIWSELLASYIAGDLLEWEVQCTSVAWRGDQLGNLLAYVYEPGGEDSAQETFIEGWTFCKQVDPEFDVRKGTRHTLQLLVRVCDEVLVGQHGLARKEVMEFWAKAFAFDTLISNTDRHAENWAIIKGQSGARMSPLYDHGSSLGCVLERVGLWIGRLTIPGSSGPLISTACGRTGATMSASMRPMILDRSSRNSAPHSWPFFRTEGGGSRRQWTRKSTQFEI